ncbi:MAG TPA: efflux transporter outer membrane subunit [Candidatus Bathyarchaeia archaeon]|nr:efflux transporter outer membrane subunit [Candidatus Bathyarchaeia archaeon]
MNVVTMKRSSGIRVRVLPALVAVACVSCSRFAPPERAAGILPVPPEFSLYEPTAPVPDRWWESLGSEELDRLVGEALEGNLGLQQIEARFRQADAVARQAGAAFWPDLGFESGVSASRRRTDTGQSFSKLDEAAAKTNALRTVLTPPAGTGVADVLRSTQSRLQAVETLASPSPSSVSRATTHSYQFGLSSGYEMDLWGRVRARYKAAVLDLETVQEDVYAAMLSLSGVVAVQWLDLVGSQQELDLVRRQLELNKTTLELMELRFKNGIATALDVFQQRQIVAQTESLIPPLEAALEVARHELAVLLGLPPRAELGVEAAEFPSPGPVPEPGLPADLLARRPDVRAAGLQLQAADWRVAAARADRLPALQLNASASYGAAEWNLVFDNWLATLAGSLAGPIFDGGRRKAEVERTRAVVDERLAAYRDLVLGSVKEVENAMLLETKQAEYVEALRREKDAAQAAHRQALQRYRMGVNDYLPVLSALTQLQSLERRLVRAELARLEYRVQLCVALGGTWMKQETTPIQPASMEKT